MTVRDVRVSDGPGEITVPYNSIDGRAAVLSVQPLEAESVVVVVFRDGLGASEQFRRWISRAEVWEQFRRWANNEVAIRSGGHSAACASVHGCTCGGGETDGTQRQ